MAMRPQGNKQTDGVALAIVLHSLICYPCQAEIKELTSLHLLPLSSRDHACCRAQDPIKPPLQGLRASPLMPPPWHSMASPTPPPSSVSCPAGPMSTAPYLPPESTPPQSQELQPIPQERPSGRGWTPALATSASRASATMASAGVLNSTSPMCGRCLVPSLTPQIGPSMSSLR